MTTKYQAKILLQDSSRMNVVFEVRSLGGDYGINDFVSPIIDEEGRTTNPCFIKVVSIQVYSDKMATLRGATVLELCEYYTQEPVAEYFMDKLTENQLFWGELAANFLTDSAPVYFSGKYSKVN